MKLQYRGQAVVTDLFIAFAIFITLILFVLIVWHYYIINLNSDMEYNNMLIKGLQITDIMVKSSGEPANWTTENVYVIGLTEGEDRIISKDKVTKLVSMEQQKVRDILKINLYHFNFYLLHPNGTKMVSYGESGESEILANIKRIVMYKNEPAILEFELWK